MKQEIDRENIKRIIKESKEYNTMLDCDTIQIGERFIDISAGDDLLENLTDVYIDQMNAQHNADQNEKGASVIDTNTHPDFEEEMKRLSDIQPDMS